MGKFTVNHFHINILQSRWVPLFCFLPSAAWLLLIPRRDSTSPPSPCPTWRQPLTLEGPLTSRELSTRLVPSLLTDSALTTSVPSNPSAPLLPPASKDPSEWSSMTPSRDSLMSSPTEKKPPNA